MKTIRWLPVLALLFLISVSCSDDAPTSPGENGDLTPEQVQGNPALLGNAFKEAQHTGMMGLIMYQQCYQLYADIYSQIFATTYPKFDSDRLSENQAWSTNCYEMFYRSPAVQQHFVEGFTANKNMPVHNAIAKTWRVQMYHRITDFWGPIPYSDFGSTPNYFETQFDSQEEIYKDFFVTLNEAITVLKANTSATPFGSDDIMYQGNVNKWITYANSLRLRLAMRLSYVEPNLAQREAEKAVLAGVFEDNSEQAMLITTSDNYNWISQWTTNRREFTMSATIHSIMVGYDDPRLDAYFSFPNTGNGGDTTRNGYFGLRNGQPSSAKADRSASVRSFSFVDQKYYPINGGGTNPKNRVMNTAEVYFLRAEGELRGWDMGMGGTIAGAENYYNEGVRHSIEDRRPDLSDTEINTYITSLDTPVPVPSQGIDTEGNLEPDLWYHPEKRDSPPVTDIPVAFNEGSASGNFEKQLEQIITQKWIATWYDGWELWSERRRTGYPIGYAILDVAPDAVIERDQLMRRLSYPATTPREINDLLGSESSADNGNNSSTRVWWDKKPIGEYPTPVD